MALRRAGLWGVAKGIFLAIFGILFSRFRAEGLIEFTIGLAILLASFHPRAYKLPTTLQEMTDAVAIFALHLVLIAQVAGAIWAMYLFCEYLLQTDLAPTWGE